MMQSKWDKNLSNLLVLALIFVFSCFVLLIGIRFINPSIAADVKLGEMDVLAFMGSLLGGLMGIIGAVYSIQYSLTSVREMSEKQDREKFIEQYPLKVKRLDKKIDELMFYQSSIKFIDAGSDETLDSIVKMGFTLVNDTEYINGIVYHDIKELEEFIYDAVDELIRGDYYIRIDNFDAFGGIVEGKEDKVKEMEKTVKNRVKKSIDLLETQKNDLRAKFVSYVN
ncbi:hypothetical protein [Paenibacillus elgii]|uniref:hypothetical protein n=1 Tax=Paenibacillus elgii TaxID=189691 RepID=UPI0020413EA5|nr:hypothetical protein [Paenibacillus elgii]MCM3270866.1 hypothetical protein [Paenibacillus elgii]